MEFNYLFCVEQQKFKALKFVVLSSYSVEIEGRNATESKRFVSFRFVLIGISWFVFGGFLSFFGFL